MDIVYSELCLIGGNVADNVERLIQYGARHIELMIDGQGWDDVRGRMEETADLLREKPVTYTVHMPVWDVNLTCQNHVMREAVKELIRESIVFASRLKASYVVIHPGFNRCPLFDRERAKDIARKSLFELLEFNKRYGMLLLVENVGVNGSSLFTPDEFTAFLDDMPSETGYLLDVGHANVNHWDICKMITDLRGRLYAVHLHDNHGRADEHLPMGEGTVDWDSVFEAVRGTGGGLHLVLEYDAGTPLEKLAEGKKMLEQAFGISD